MKHRTTTAFATVFAALAAMPAAAQDSGWGVAADIGLGAEVQPEWIGADKMKTSPWAILRNVELTRPGKSATLDGSSDGFRVLPSIGWRGGRKSDDTALAGLDKIDGTVEAGVRFRYTNGPATAMLMVRKGFGGHTGLAGSFGAKYRIAPNDRLTLWPGVQAKFGDDNFTQKFFGVSGAEAARSSYDAYKPQGGVYSAGVTLEARYAVTDTLGLVGELEYSRLVGDAADAPFIQSKTQPAVRMGIVHRFNLRF